MLIRPWRRALTVLKGRIFGPLSKPPAPRADGMHSLPHLLQQFGYGSAVLYGGNPSFDNMGTFWKGIGFDQVWGESDIRHDSFNTI